MKLVGRKRAAARSHASGGLPLDATALEAVDRFVRVLARCGCSASDILQAFRDACERLPKKNPATPLKAQRELSNASHILTVWFSDTLYLDRAGKPIWLPVRGAAPSLEALVARVDPTLDVEDLVRYLRRTKVLKRNGARYAPRRRILSLRGAQGPEVFRNLRSLVGLLRTLEHNMQPKRATRSWFEYWAENPAFPVRGRAAFDTRLDDLGMKFLHAIDADMHRREVERAPGERTVRMGVGVYRFEDDGTGEPAPALNGGRRRRRTGRRKERRSG
jgi:hypothetical protein